MNLYFSLGHLRYHRHCHHRTTEAPWGGDQWFYSSPLQRSTSYLADCCISYYSALDIGENPYWMCTEAQTIDSLSYIPCWCDSSAGLHVLKCEWGLPIWHHGSFPSPPTGSTSSPATTAALPSPRDSGQWAIDTTHLATWGTPGCQRLQEPDSAAENK